MGGFFSEFLKSNGKVIQLELLGTSLLSLIFFYSLIDGYRRGQDRGRAKAGKRGTLIGEWEDRIGYYYL